MRASPRSALQTLTACNHDIDILEIADTLVAFMQNAPVELFLPIAAERLIRLLTRTAKIAILGLGYGDLPLSLLSSDAGFSVTGFDIVQDKVDELEAGRSYILRIPEDEIEHTRKREFRATFDFAQLAEQEAIILCLAAPLREHHEPDLSFIESTTTTLKLRIARLVVGSRNPTKGIVADTLWGGYHEFF